MPASTSSPPPQSDVSGLKTYANYDAVLPSSPEVERLTPVPASQQSTSGSPGDTTGSNHQTPGSNFTLESTNGMSSAEVEFMGVDSFGTFDNDFFEDREFNYFQEPVPPAAQDPVSATTINSRSGPSRVSTGLATLSSQLLSPELSDAPSPEAQHADVAADKVRFFSSAAMSRESTHGVGPGSLPGPTMAPPPGTMISSAHMSPNLSQTSAYRGAPQVQVESYTRGDSPARIQNVPNALQHKRSRTSQSSLHLAPDQGTSQEGSLEESHEVFHKQQDDAMPAQRGGLDPSSRQQLGSQPVMSLADREEFEQVKKTKEGVSRWLVTSQVGEEAPPPDDTEPRVQALRVADSRLRARSTAGGPRQLQADALGIEQGLRDAQDAQIPGPGELVEEMSDEEYEDNEYVDSDAEPAPPSIDGRLETEKATVEVPAIEEGMYAPDEASPWVDPISIPSHPDLPAQPGTSNDAMMRFLQRSRDIDNVSRVATWGTGAVRRLSDGDLEKVFGSGGLFSRLSISRERSRPNESESDKAEWRNFKQSVEQAALRLIPKRTTSTSRRKRSEPARPTTRDSIFQHGRQDSQTDLRDRKEGLGGPLRRISSSTKRSPKINTTAAVVGTTSIASLGGAGASMSSSNATSPTTAKKGALQIARERLSRHASQDGPNPNITNLLVQHGGPPVANLSTAALPPADEVASPLDEVDEDEKQLLSAPEKEEKAVAMNLTPRQEMIIPTFEGFKTHVRNVNPRLPPFLVERLGQEQLRRYKKLVEFKVKHAQVKASDSCASKDFCVERGQHVTYFPAKGVPQKDAKATSADDDEDEEAVADGVITDATFPPGVPMPPVKRLPAQFECPLCFQVKKLQKPSDWSKHVHEDLQPFTCTFPNCPDPKSFKRKADWVRHENERHRQLEWWRCTEEGCAHQCFRRDNFVQHLVREHKMPEPKAKPPTSANATASANGGAKKAVRGPAKGKPRGGTGGATTLPHPADVPPEEKVLLMVELCRHETPKHALEEPCRFCGNVCNSFKKLTVHLARHMEQIAIPVLDLVKVKDVTAETVVSPIESKIPQGNAGVDAYTGDAVGVGGYDPTLAALDRSQPPELPANFTPLQGTTGFHPPTYATMVPQVPSQWSTADPQIVSLSGVSASAYIPGTMAQQSWLPTSPMYGGERAVAPSYGMPSSHADGYDAIHRGVNPAMSNPAMAARGFAQGNGMIDAAEMERNLPPNPTFVNPGLSPAHQHAGGGMGYIQGPGGPTGYQARGTQGHQGQQHQQQQQQQYFGRY